MARDEESDTRLPFSWIGADVALDFHNTVSWTSTGPRQERLRRHADLVAWAVEAGLQSGAPGLPAAAQAGAPVGRVLAEARHLRRALHEVLSPLARRRRPDEDAFRDLEDAVSRALSRRRLELKGRCVLWGWEEAGAPGSALRLPLLEVAWAAGRLLTSPDMADLRACANAECGWLFLDRSRRRNRRWCEMSVCGSRDKSRRYYRKLRTARRDD